MKKILLNFALLSLLVSPLGNLNAQDTNTNQSTGAIIGETISGIVVLAIIIISIVKTKTNAFGLSDKQKQKILNSNIKEIVEKSLSSNITSTISSSDLASILDTINKSSGLNLEPNEKIAQAVSSVLNELGIKVTDDFVSTLKEESSTTERVLKEDPNDFPTYDLIKQDPSGYPIEFLTFATQGQMDILLKNEVDIEKLTNFLKQAKLILGEEKYETFLQTYNKELDAKLNAKEIFELYKNKETTSKELSILVAVKTLDEITSYLNKESLSPAESDKLNKSIDLYLSVFNEEKLISDLKFRKFPEDKIDKIIKKNRIINLSDNNTLSEIQEDEPKSIKIDLDGKETTFNRISSINSSEGLIYQREGSSAIIENDQVSCDECYKLNEFNELEKITSIRIIDIDPNIIREIKDRTQIAQFEKEKPGLLEDLKTKFNNAIKDSNVEHERYLKLHSIITEAQIANSSGLQLSDKEIFDAIFKENITNLSRLSINDLNDLLNLITPNKAVSNDEYPELKNLSDEVSAFKDNFAKIKQQSDLLRQKTAQDKNKSTYSQKDLENFSRLGQMITAQIGDVRTELKYVGISEGNKIFRSSEGKDYTINRDGNFEELTKPKEASTDTTHTTDATAHEAHITAGLTR